MNWPTKAGSDDKIGDRSATPRGDHGRLCQHRAAAWGALGARIVTISPGLISTPMARKEVAENPNARGHIERTPAGRWGTALDIANVAEFLASDLASFVSGSDVRVDGGLMAVLAV